MELKDLKIFDVNEWATVENYPYGFRNRCTLKAMIEETKNGQRVKTQTIYKGVENKPKCSTYGTGRFLAQDKEGILYSCCYIIGESVYNELSGKYEPKTRITIYQFRGKRELVKILEATEENKALIPKSILKQVEIKNKVDDLLNKAFDNVRKKAKEQFKGKSHNDIRNHILNHLNWVVGGGGYYFKDGFGRNYNNNVMVSFACDFFSESFTVEDTSKLRLTKKGKEEVTEKARNKLKDWLQNLEPEYITIQERENNFPTVQIGNKTII